MEVEQTPSPTEKSREVRGSYRMKMQSSNNTASRFTLTQTINFFRWVTQTKLSLVKLKQNKGLEEYFQRVLFQLPH